MPELDRITRFGMLEDLKIRNDEMWTINHLLTEYSLPPLVQIILGYVFVAPGIIHSSIIDKFASSDWPNFEINGMVFYLEYKSDLESHTGVVNFSHKNYDWNDCDIRIMWYIIIHESYNHEILWLMTCASSLRLDGINEMTIDAIRKFSAEMLDG